jgi:hypothetical protein
MSSGVSLAPSIKAALRKITAKEPSVQWSDLARDRQRFLASLAEIASEPRPKKWTAPARPTVSAPGRFWATDQNSDSECEDLGVADEIGVAVTPSTKDANSKGPKDPPLKAKELPTGSLAGEKGNLTSAHKVRIAVDAGNWKPSSPTSAHKVRIAVKVSLFESPTHNVKIL